MEPTEESSRTPERDFARLQREHENALRLSKEQIQKWEQFKGDYEALQVRLYTLPDKLTHDVMVPLGRFAFMPGQLYHTNEILVLLGDNWFAKRSAKQAIEIAERRKQYVSKFLEDEKKQLSDWEARLAFTAGFKSTVEERDGTVEIKEEYHPEEDKKRKTGKARVQRESRAPPPRQVFPRGAPATPPLPTLAERDKGLWARLEQLEKEEEEFLRQETERELANSESLVAGVDANTPHKLSSLSTVSQKEELGQAPGEHSSLSDRLKPLSYGQENSQDYEEGSSADKPRRKVTFVGDDTNSDGGGSCLTGNQRGDKTVNEDKHSPLRITFTHTQTQLSVNDNEFGVGSSKSEESEPRERLLFSSPADIYTHFCKPTLVSSDSEQCEGGASVAQKAVTWDSKLVSYSEEKGNTSSSKATAAAAQAKKPQLPAASAVPFSGRVIERISSRNTPSAPEPPRKISKFKASRQNK